MKLVKVLHPGGMKLFGKRVMSGEVVELSDGDADRLRRWIPLGYLEMSDKPKPKPKAKAKSATKKKAPAKKKKAESKGDN